MKKKKKIITDNVLTSCPCSPSPTRAPYWVDNGIFSACKALLKSLVTLVCRLLRQVLNVLKIKRQKH